MGQIFEVKLSLRKIDTTGKASRNFLLIRHKSALTDWTEVIGLKPIEVAWEIPKVVPGNSPTITATKTPCLQFSFQLRQISCWNSRAHNVGTYKGMLCLMKRVHCVLIIHSF